jgi:hypothetical protein
MEARIALSLLSARSRLLNARRLNAFQSKRPALGNGVFRLGPDRLRRTANCGGSARV